MDTPNTILGVLGAGIALIFIVVRAILASSAKREENRKKLDAEIDKISNADDVIRVADRLHK